MTSTLLLVLFSLGYGAVFVLEAMRLRRRAAFAPQAVLVAAAGAVTLQTLFLMGRAIGQSASPLSTPYDWYLLAAWALAVVYLYLGYEFPKAAMGLFFMPLVLALIGGAQFAGVSRFSPERASRLWGNIHGAFLLLGTVSVLVGFVAGLMYLLQSRRLKQKRMPTARLRLPSLEWLERASGRALHWSVLLIGIGFVSGAILVAGRGSARATWTDPVVLSLSLMFFWLVAASIFNLAYRPARRGRKVAYLTVANFVFLAIVLAVLLLSSSQHAVPAAKLSQNPEASPFAASGSRPEVSREARS